MLCIARDVTEEREQAAELARSEARYTRLADSAEDAVATVDLDGRLTSVNRILEVVTGRSKDALYGTSFLDYIDHDERLPMQQMLAATIAGLRRRRDLAFTYADGRKGVSTVLSAPIREDGLVVGALLVARDVTEERMRLEQIARRDRLAAIGELVGSVAHEINSPLTGILAFAQILLAQGGLSTDGRQAAETIETEAKRAARTVRNLLTFARQPPPERVPTDLNQVLQDALVLRRHSIEALGIVLEVGLKARLPVTWADPTQLQQVVLCLLTNAEQAVTRAAGERRITVRSSREGESLIMSVADSGHGIAPEHLPHIFNSFYTTKPRGIGTGLGLSISDGIVREHHGSLRVHSEPGQGARFEVVLPLLSPSATHPV